MNTFTAFNNLSYFNACLLLIRDFISEKMLPNQSRLMALEQIEMAESLGANEYRDTFHDLEAATQASYFFTSNAKAVLDQCPIDKIDFALNVKHAQTQVTADNLHTAQCLLEDILMNDPEHKALNDPELAPQFLAELLFEISVDMDAGYDVLTDKLNVENSHCWDFEIIPRALEYLAGKNKSLLSMGVYTWAALILKIIKECDRQMAMTINSQKALS